MSASNVAAAPSKRLQKDAFALRFGLGVMASLGFGLAIDLPLAFLAPVLAVPFLHPSKPPLYPLLQLALPIIVFVLTSIIGAVSGFLATHADVLLVSIALALFLCFYSMATKGGSPVIGLVMTITLVVGTLAATSDVLADQISRALPLAMLCASLGTILAHAVFPFVRRRPAQRGQSMQGGGPKGTEERTPNPTFIALTRMLIAMPLVVWFVTQDVVGHFYVLLVAAGLLQLDVPSEGGFVAVMGSMIGAGIALLCATLIEATPSVLFALLLLAGVSIVLGLQLGRGGTRSALANAAAAPVMLLIATTVAPIGEGGQGLERTWLVFLTAAYVMIARLASDRRQRA